MPRHLDQAHRSFIVLAVLVMQHRMLSGLCIGQRQGDLYCSSLSSGMVAGIGSAVSE